MAGLFAFALASGLLAGMAGADRAGAHEGRMAAPAPPPTLTARGVPPCSSTSVDYRLLRFPLVATPAGEVSRTGDGANEPPPIDRSSSVPKPVALGAAFVPGIVLHGSGTWADGRRTTGVRLLAMEGIGLGLIGLGGVPIVLSGASRRIIGPATVITLAGFGLFSMSFLADIYGVLAPEEQRGRPQLTPPTIETQLGYRYVYDPQFRYRNFMVSGVDIRWRSLRAAPSGWFALDDRNARMRLLGAYRFVGPLPSATSHLRHGSFLDVELAFTRHHYASDRFRIHTGEVFLNGRLDFSLLDRVLRGSFAEMGFGTALQAFDYELPGTEIETEYEELLLMRFGYGIYMSGGGALPSGSEVVLYYDHRHDDYAAGFITSIPGSGVPGHFGLESRFFVSEQWGFLSDLQVGSAYVAGLSLLFRNRGGS